METNLLSKRKHNRKTPTFVLAGVGLVITTLVLIFSLFTKFAPGLNSDERYQGFFAIIGFDFFQQFTQQVNTLLIIFYVLFIFFFRTRLFNNKKFLVYVVSYITLVMAIAGFIISPIFVFNGTTKTNWVTTCETCLVHLLTPVIFIIFSIFFMKYPQRSIKMELPFMRYTALGFIYPAIYFTYLISINFVNLPASIFSSNYPPIPNGNHYISIYSILSNYNSKCLIPVGQNNAGTYSPDNINNAGNIGRILVVPVVLGFYLLETGLYVYINNRVNLCYIKAPVVNA